MKLVVCALLVAVVASFPGPAADDVVFLEEVYTSSEQARMAAEKELASMGDQLETPDYLTSEAEKEALSMAIATEQDPMHEGMEGIKVDLGQVDVPAAPAVTDSDDLAVAEDAPIPAVAAPVPVPDMHVANSNKNQASVIDVPMAPHAPKKQATRKNTVSLLVEEQLPEGQLMGDDGMMLEGGASRPSAPQFPQFGFPQFGMPQGNMFAMPQQNQGQLFSPDVEANTAVLGGNQKLHSSKKAHGLHAHQKAPQMPGQNMFGFPQMMPGMNMMGQMPQAAMPQGMPQMPQMMQGMPQMPQMMQGMPQMPQMMQGMPGMPQLPQLSQMFQGMPNMAQMPQMAGMPQMPMFPGFGAPQQ